MLKRRQLVYRILAMLCAIAAVSQSACRRDESGDQAAESVTDPIAESQPAHLLVFPDSLYVEDASVNAFLRRAMGVCARGEYEAFRLLWSAREDPLTRADFETGWQAVQEIRIRALEHVMLAAETGDDDAKNSSAYAVFAEVQLDPSLPAGQRESHREVVLLIVREHDEWRLGDAPKPVRGWIKKQIVSRSTPSDNIVNQPPGKKPD